MVPIVTAEAMKPQPSWSARASQAAASTAMTASDGTAGPKLLPAMTRVQMTNPSTAAMAAQESGAPVARVRSRTTPVVRG